MGSAASSNSANGALAVLVAVAVLVVSGCGNDDHPGESAAPRATDTVAPARCPQGLPSCRSAQGRITFVERVDPDGDGDAHFVIADPQGITLPGLTAIDVRKGLRPRPLPGVGDLISAAGPVQTGSYGQSQIHALELHVTRGGHFHQRHPDRELRPPLGAQSSASYCCTAERSVRDDYKYDRQAFAWQQRASTVP